MKAVARFTGRAARTSSGNVMEALLHPEKRIEPNLA
jgi:hypothetical protein